MSTVQGLSRVVARPRPDGDVVVAAFRPDGGEQLVRIAGLDACDYLTPGEALALARALVAALSDDELTPG